MSAVDLRPKCVAAIAALALASGSAEAREVRTALHGQSETYRHAVECSATGEWLWTTLQGQAGISQAQLDGILVTRNRWKAFAIGLGEASAEDTDWDLAAQSFDMTMDWSANGTDFDAYLEERVRVFAECFNNPPP